MRYFKKIASISNIYNSIVHNPGFEYIDKNVDYMGNLLRHKYEVYNAARELDVPIVQALGHDMNKFDPLLFVTYRDFFFGKNGIRGTNDPLVKEKFTAAAKLHRLMSDHHGTVTNPKPGIDMSDRMEAVADWYGAAMRAQNYPSNRPSFNEWINIKRPWLRKTLGADTMLELDTRLGS